MRTIGLLTLAVLFPAFALATELVNINTADATLLDTVPEIGPTIAERIVAYREANGPFATIEGIQEVKGIGSGVTYTKIAPFITVGDGTTSGTDTDQTASSTPPNISSDVPDTATDTVTPPTSIGPPEYLPIPELYIVTSGDKTVSSGAETVFTAIVYDDRGHKRDDAVVAWSFGDGMQRVGANILHPYYEPGEYLAVVRATTTDGGNALSEIVITVKNARIKITGVSSRGITLANSDSRTLDLSFWRLAAGGQEFKIPENTHILAGRSILFPVQVIELPLSGAAMLLYPSGEVADTYPTTAPVSLANANTQPSSGGTSYQRVQAVEPISSTRSDAQSNGQQVNAPAAATELAAAGAALPPPTLSVGAPTSDIGTASTPRFSGIFKSPWTLGFIGTVLLAGGAFILL